jgi:hypothetical protein
VQPRVACFSTCRCWLDRRGHLRYYATYRGQTRALSRCNSRFHCNSGPEELLPSAPLPRPPKEPAHTLTRSGTPKMYQPDKTPSLHVKAPGRTNHRLIPLTVQTTRACVTSLRAANRAWQWGVVATAPSGQGTCNINSFAAVALVPPLSYPAVRFEESRARLSLLDRCPAFDEDVVRHLRTLPRYQMQGLTRRPSSARHVPATSILLQRGSARVLYVRSATPTWMNHVRAKPANLVVINNLHRQSRIEPGTERLGIAKHDKNPGRTSSAVAGVDIDRCNPAGLCVKSL